MCEELKTASGKSLKVIYQGQYNTFNGPDFKNAVINLDGENKQGDVEIHLRTYDWIAHQHQEDRAYNNTVLHVVYEHKALSAYTIREDAAGVEILELKNQTAPEIAKLFSQYQNPEENRTPQACDYFTLTTDEQLISLLKAEGWERILRKVARFNAELQFHSFDQLLYNGFMEALGYGKNKFNTLALAQQFAWDTLQEWKGAGLTDLALAAIWIYYSGLVTQAGRLLGPELSELLARAYEEQNFTTAKGNLHWNLFRIRPLNHPVKRLVQASLVIDKLLDRGFLTFILTAFQSSDKGKPLSFITNIQSQINVTRFRDIEIGKIGTNMLQTMAGNIFLPVIFLYAQKTNDHSLQDQIIAAYNQMTAENGNYITSFMGGYLNQQQLQLCNKKFIYQQGVMNLYFRFCNYRLCDLCLAERSKKLQKM